MKSVPRNRKAQLSEGNNNMKCSNQAQTSELRLKKICYQSVEVKGSFGK